MNVAVVCPNDYSTVNFCKGILHEFKGRRDVHDVFVISDIYGENTDGYYSRILESWGVRHIPLQINRFMSPRDDLRYLLRLRRILRDHAVDVVVNISTKPNIYGTFAAKLAGARRVLCAVWGRGRVFSDDDTLRARSLRLLLSILYRFAFSLSTKVWFTNPSDFSYFTEHGLVDGGKALLTKNYVNTDDYAPTTLPPDVRSRLLADIGASTEDRIVLMVGRMIWTKGVREFIEAAALLRDRLPGVKLVLVGPEEPGSPDSIPPDYLEHNRSTSNFIWVGFRKDVKDLYALADLAVLPSYYREGGYPRALTEPMSMGKPVIAADTDDCRAPVTPGVNGFLVPVKNPAALADKIHLLMQDASMRRQFGENSRQKAVAEYDETHIVRNLIAAFCPDTDGDKSRDSL